MDALWAKDREATSTLGQLKPMTSILYCPKLDLGCARAPGTEAESPASVPNIGTEVPASDAGRAREDSVLTGGEVGIALAAPAVGSS